jgi:glycosyltransferase involved in cell wall biosynthesis
MTPFSVLMSVYRKERADNFDQCLESLAAQTVSANEIVVVKDGILTDELERCLAYWQNRLPLKIVGYETNQGLAHALNYGFGFVTNELVARMDSDDICVSDRFEKQARCFEDNAGISVASGFVTEFENDPLRIHAVRILPLRHEDIVRCAKRRSPFNHMAVMYKKSAVERCGMYQASRLEDYDLWLTMLSHGYKAMNLPVILVNVRTGNDMVGRRRGLKYAASEHAVFKKHHRSGFLSFGDYLFLCAFRLPARLLPKFILKFLYKVVLR